MPSLAWSEKSGAWSPTLSSAVVVVVDVAGAWAEAVAAAIATSAAVVRKRIDYPPEIRNRNPFYVTRKTNRSLALKFRREQSTTATRLAATGGRPSNPTNSRMSTRLPASEIKPLLA